MFITVTPYEKFHRRFLYLRAEADQPFLLLPDDQIRKLEQENPALHRKLIHEEADGEAYVAYVQADEFLDIGFRCPRTVERLGRWTQLQPDGTFTP
jgi:hypothetical protein